MCVEHAWLAGIWEGEGSISLFSHQEKNGCKKLKPVCTVVNSDLGIIDKIISIMEEENLPYYVVCRNNSKKNKRHRDVYEVKITTAKGISRFLPVILPYLYGEKQHRAEILLRFVLRRLQRRADKGRNDKATYTEDDWNDLDVIRSSQTTREASN